MIGKIGRPGKFAAGMGMVVLSVCVADPPEIATVAAAVKTLATKTVTNSLALCCMDDLLLAYGKRDIVITTAGISIPWARCSRHEGR
jgi:hypothetical protein